MRSLLASAILLSTVLWPCVAEANGAPTAPRVQGGPRAVILSLSNPDVGVQAERLQISFVQTNKHEPWNTASLSVLVTATYTLTAARAQAVDVVFPFWTGHGPAPEQFRATLNGSPLALQPLSAVSRIPPGASGGSPAGCRLGFGLCLSR